MRPNLKKIKSKCDFFITSDSWITNDFKKIKNNYQGERYKWVGNENDEKSLLELKAVISFIMEDLTEFNGGSLDDVF